MASRKVKKEVYTWNIVELEFTSQTQHANPYKDVDLWVTFVSPEGEEKKVPGFWDGGNVWRARFAPSEAGVWKWYSKEDKTCDGGLNGQSGQIEVLPYKGENPIYTHGFLRVNDNGRGFEHYDGTPFFWLGDTVWAISSRATEDEWNEYVDFRSKQGYNIVQTNSLPQHDASGTDYRQPFVVEESGWNLLKPNIDYFKYLDRLIAMTAGAGMFTAMVVLWFDYVPGTNPKWGAKRKAIFNVEQSALFGRYLAARYGAFGTIWLITGDSDFEDPGAIAVYDAAAKAIKESAPYKPLMTAHLNGGLYTPENLNEKEWLSFHMYQSSHGKGTRENSLLYAEKDRVYMPVRPVLNGEPCYEGIGYFGQPETVSREKVREVAWASILGGGNAGITYGAHGLWSWHREGEVFRDAEYWHMPSDWHIALRFEGAEDVARMKKFFVELPWWELEPSKGLILEARNEELAASTPDQKVIIAYITECRDIAIDIISGEYKGEWFNPITGKSHTARVSPIDGKLEIKGYTWQGEAVLLLKKV